MKFNKYKILSLIGLVGSAALGLVGGFADGKIQEQEIDEKVNEKVAEALTDIFNKGEE